MRRIYEYTPQARRGGALGAAGLLDEWRLGRNAFPVLPTSGSS